MNLIHKILILLFGVAISVQAVPPVLNYAGQVAVNGEAFDGNGLFKFALVDTDGMTTYWSNDGTSVDGSEPQASVAVVVSGGLYSLLLGNTAQQGMGAIDPAVFAQHTDAKLRVWFSDGVNGFQQLSPDRPFASVPYAFNSESAKSADTALNAETAKTADSANVATTAMAVQVGAITKQMLGQDVLSDLNRTVNHNDLSSQIKADINATIGMNRLSTEVTEKLNQEKTTTNYNAPSIGSLLAVSEGQPVPHGYEFYQSGLPAGLKWIEKAKLNIGRFAYDGVEVLGDKIYFVGGHNGHFQKIVERYDPISDKWSLLQPLSVARNGVSTAVSGGKLFAIGGWIHDTVEIYDPESNSWTYGPKLPEKISHACAISIDDKIYLMGGLVLKNGEMLSSNKVYFLDVNANEWTTRNPMLVERQGHKMLVIEDEIWVIGGGSAPEGSGLLSTNLEIYNPIEDHWKQGPQLKVNRQHAIAWYVDKKLFVGGGSHEFYKQIDVYDKEKGYWEYYGLLPSETLKGAAVVMNDFVYFIPGKNSTGYTDKFYAADLNQVLKTNLYLKTGDAPVGTPVVQSEYADGSVTTSKLDATILKYLKPEITSQPQAQTVYADTNVSYSVTAEGKYLTYQWKKDGVDLVGETNATLNITDTNATLHDGNYSVVVSNDFGSEESGIVEVLVSWSPDSHSELVLWLDASDLSTIVKDANKYVSRWSDKSANNNHANQSSSVDMPLYNNISMFGKPGLVFDNDELHISPVDMVDKTFFAVLKTDVVQMQNIISTDSSSSNVQLRITDSMKLQYASLSPMFERETGSLVTDSTINVPHDQITIVAFIFYSTLGFSVNGVFEDSEITKNVSGFSSFNQIGTYSHNETRFDGQMGEIIVIDSVLSSTRQKVEGYLAHKWGLTANLPSEHPYKNNAP